MNTAPIFIVDDDEDDHEFIREIWQELEYENPLMFFSNSQQFLSHLQTEHTTPFLIICEVNMRRMNGFELKEKIQGDTRMRYKSIPLVFWTTAPSNDQIKRSYDLGGNGFFKKASNLEDLKTIFVKIVEYWHSSQVPV